MVVFIPIRKGNKPGPGRLLRRKPFSDVRLSWNLKPLSLEVNMKNVDEVAIFWDYENCPAPTNTSGYAIVNSIRSIAQTFGSVKLFKAYLEVTEQVPMSRAVLLRSELQSSGVSLTDCPHNGRKDVADKMILVDMLAHAIDNAAPSTIVLISGDRDFAYALSILRFRRYRIVLITHSNAHQSLRAQASISFDWVSEILEPVDSTSSNQPTSPRRGKMSSPPAHDRFYSDSMGHNPSSSLFQESYHDDRTSVNTVNNFQDETRCMEISPTPSKLNVKQDSLPPYLERQLAASSMTLDNGPESPARDVHFPVASSHTYPNGQMPSATSACSSESHFTSRTTQTQLRLLQALQESQLTETSCHLGVLYKNSPLIHKSAPLPHQQGSSPINATQPLSSVDRMAVDDNHPDSPQSPPANVSAKVTAPAPSLTPSSSTLSSATVSAIPQISANRRLPTPSIAVPDKFKILIRCLKSYRSRGYLNPLRRIISSEIDQNGTTYRQAGVSAFGEYVVMAEKAGIVEQGGSELTAWIALKAPWYNVRLS